MRQRIETLSLSFFVFHTLLFWLSNKQSLFKGKGKKERKNDDIIICSLFYCGLVIKEEFNECLSEPLSYPVTAV